MEVWLLACMLLVFLSLVEYAVILRFTGKYKRRAEEEKKKRRVLDEINGTVEVDT